MEGSDKSEGAHSVSPTLERISQDDWAMRCQEARSKKKWVLVNIQDLVVRDRQLPSGVIWEDSEVKLLISREFIFLQYSKKDEGVFLPLEERIPTYKNQGRYPYVAVVNPFTEEVVNSLEEPSVPKPDLF